MGCIKFVYTEHIYKSSEPFCSRSQYGELKKNLVFLTFETVDKFLWFYHVNETS